MISQIYKLDLVSYEGMNKKIIPVFITIIMFSSIQIANPVWGFLIGFFMWKKEEQNKGFIKKRERCV